MSGKRAQKKVPSPDDSPVLPTSVAIRSLRRRLWKACQVEDEVSALWCYEVSQDEWCALIAKEKVQRPASNVSKRQYATAPREASASDREVGASERACRLWSIF